MRVELLCVGAMFALSGCFSVDLDDLAKEAPEKRRFLLEVSPPAAAASSRRDAVLLVEQVHALAPYNGRPLVYRTGEFEHSVDYYNEFLISPAEQLTQIAQQYLQASGPYRSVVHSDSLMIVGLTLSLDLLEMRGDYRSPNSPAGVVAIRASLVDRAGDEVRVILRKSYTARIEQAARTPEALVRSLSDATAEVLQKLVADLPAD